VKTEGRFTGAVFGFLFPHARRTRRRGKSVRPLERFGARSRTSAFGWNFPPEKAKKMSDS
jgi:hypothetical protein